MIATIVIGILALVGAAFLLAATYMSLSVVLSPALAALLVGAGLMTFALAVWLISSLTGRRSVTRRVEVAAAAGQGPSTEQAVDQVCGMLKDASPLHALATAAGLLVGVYLKNRSS
jgi:hypothetical protein